MCQWQGISTFEDSLIWTILLICTLSDDFKPSILLHQRREIIGNSPQLGLTMKTYFIFGGIYANEVCCIERKHCVSSFWAKPIVICYLHITSSWKLYRDLEYLTSYDLYHCWIWHEGPPSPFSSQRFQHWVRDQGGMAPQSPPILHVPPILDHDPRISCPKDPEPLSIPTQFHSLVHPLKKTEAPLCVLLGLRSAKF